jgi:hypothetical protein
VPLVGKLFQWPITVISKGILSILLTRRLNSQLRHAGLDPASSVLLDSRLRGNDELRVFTSRSNKKDGAKRLQQIFNFQSSIFNSGLSGIGASSL